jgi:NADH-quinone oxidoreductase subunit N
MGASGPQCPMQLWALYPELLIAGLGLMLVPVAGWARGRSRYVPVWAAMAGVAVSTVLTARMLFWEPMTIFCGTYAIDGFANGFKLILELGALVTLLLCLAYFRPHAHIAHAPLAILFSTLGGMALASCLDLGLIVLFLQMLSMASYLLVCLRREEPLANEATLKYFIFAAAALAVMAYGLTFLYGMSGSLNLVEIGRVVDTHADRVWLVVSLGLIVVGYAFEITLVPFHFWVPDVFQGATAPVSGFLSVVPKVAGFAGLLRLLLSAFAHQLPAWPWLMAVLAAATMAVGNLTALRQTRLKRLLAYSSIAQAGYVLMAVAVSARAGGALSAAGFYLGAYLFMNLGAFAVTAQVERALGTDRIAAFQGLGRVLPLPSAALALSLLSLAGIPPLAGFAGKIFLLTAAMDGGFGWLALFAVINMTVALYYYVAVVAQIYLRPAPVQLTFPKTGLAYGGVLAICALGTLLFGAFAELMLTVTGFIEIMVGF